jgi:hypothetical protein
MIEILIGAYGLMIVLYFCHWIYPVFDFIDRLNGEYVDGCYTGEEIAVLFAPVTVALCLLMLARFVFVKTIELLGSFLVWGLISIRNLIDKGHYES